MGYMRPDSGDVLGTQAETFSSSGLDLFDGLTVEMDPSRPGAAAKPPALQSGRTASLLSSIGEVSNPPEYGAGLENTDNLQHLEREDSLDTLDLDLVELEEPEEHSDALPLLNIPGKLSSPFPKFQIHSCSVLYTASGSLFISLILQLSRDLSFNPMFWLSQND